MIVTAEDAWRAALHQLELQFDRPTFNTWVRDAAFLRLEGDDLFVIGVKNTYAREMLQHKLYRNIRRVLSDVYGRSVELRFDVHKAESAPAPAADPDADMPLFRMMAQLPGAEDGTPLHQRITRPKRADLPESELNPLFTLSRFMAGGENAMVYEAVQAVAERPGLAYNPLFIHGSVGTGKTHLLQGVAHVCKQRGLRAIYISSEVFTNDLIEAIRSRTAPMFREKYRTADVLLVDDVQFFTGKESTQEEFFHTFNTLHAYGKQIVLSSDRHPRELLTLEDRLRSRFEGGLVVDVLPPSVETRIAILKTWAQDKGVSIQRPVLELLASRARTNVRELSGLFNQMLATMQHARAPMTEDLLLEIFDGYQRPRYTVTVQRVLEVVARHHGLRPEDLIGPRRNAHINQARQIAMYIAREVTNASLPQIGEAFGGRKHSTVLHACNSISEQLTWDETIAKTVESLRAKLLKKDD